MLRSARTVLLFGIAVQCAAFLRTAIIAATLGASRDVDAYNLGLIAPSFISSVVGSWLQLSFVGRYTTLVTTGEIQTAIAYRSRMLVIVLLSALSLALITYFLPSPLLSLFMPAGQSGATASAALALKFAGFMLVPIIVGDFIALVLNSHERFFAASLAPLVNALVSSIGLLLWPRANLEALIATLLLGSFSQCLVVIVALLKLPHSSFICGSPPRGEILKTLLLALPLLAATMFSNAVTAIVQFQTAAFGEGAVSLYGYASRLHGALAQVLVIGLSTVLLPHFAVLWSSNRREEILALFRRLARSVLLISAYATLGIYTLGASATRFLLQRGAFDEHQTMQVSWLWALLSLALFPSAFGTFIAKFSQAMRGAGSILLSSTIALFVTWLVARSGASHGNLEVVVSSIAISQLFVTLFWLAWLARQIAVVALLVDIGVSVLRAAVILVPSAGITLWLGTFTRDWPDMVDLLVRGAIYTLAGIVIFAATGSYRWYFAGQPRDRSLS